jgi:hypothetical protein
VESPEFCRTGGCAMRVLFIQQDHMSPTGRLVTAFLALGESA